MPHGTQLTTSCDLQILSPSLDLRMVLWIHHGNIVCSEALQAALKLGSVASSSAPLSNGFSHSGKFQKLHELQDEIVMNFGKEARLDLDSNCIES